MDLQQLREETRPEHEATEAAMPLMAPDLSLPTYIRVLQTLLALLRSWETWAEGEAPETVRALLPARRRSHLLEADLRALGASAGVTAAPVDWDAVVTDDSAVRSRTAFEASFLGAFYVVEGSTLGGRFLARQVEATLQLQPGLGNAYFQGHGEATGALWRETSAAVAAVPEENAAMVIGAAKRTFLAFGSVLKPQGSSSPAELADG